METWDLFVGLFIYLLNKFTWLPKFTHGYYTANKESGSESEERNNLGTSFSKFPNHPSII